MISIKYCIIGFSAIIGSELMYLFVKYLSDRKQKALKSVHKREYKYMVLFFPDEGLINRPYGKIKRDSNQALENPLALQPVIKNHDTQTDLREMDSSSLLEDLKQYSTSLKHMIIAIERAERSIVICVYCFSLMTVATAVVQAKKRGVSVRVLMEQEMSEKCIQTIKFLQKYNIEVCRGKPEFLMHHKFAVIDGPSQKDLYLLLQNELGYVEDPHQKTKNKNLNKFKGKYNLKSSEDFNWKDKCVLMTGSFNWTWSAVVRNSENVVIINNPDLVCQFSKEFERLWVSRESFSFST